MAVSLSIRRYQGERGLRSLYDPWTDLMTAIKRQGFFQHPAWFRAFFARPSSTPDALEFCAVYRGPSLVAVLPLIWTRRAAARLAEASLAGGEGLYMPDWAIADREDKARIWGLLRRELGWDVFSVRDTLESSSIAECLATETRFTRVVTRGSRCAVLDIMPYADALGALKKKFRGNLNNARHRLERQEQVEFLRITNPAEVDWAFTEFVAVEQSGWKGNPARKRDNYPAPAAIALKESKLKFYGNVVQQFALLGALEIYLLRVNGKTIGGQILIVLNDVSYLLKTAFDEDAREFSPGHLLLEFAYRCYADEGRITELNMISDYDWFKNWNPRYLDYVSIKDFNFTVSGVLGSALYRAKRSVYEPQRTSR